MTPATARRLGLTALVLLAAFFLVYRWEMRREPANNDDLTLFTNSQWATEGHHWINGPKGNPPTNHQSLRIGLFPVSVPVLGVLGPTSTAYYLVPLLFAFVGFLCVWWVIDREISPLWALASALVHAVLPFEVMDASRFLVDLPTALMSLAGLVLIGLAGESEGRRARIGLGATAGLAILWAYLLRSNAPVLLVPALGLLLVYRATRLPTVVAGVTFALGVLAEQLLWMSRGLEWGFRWKIVDEALAGYSPFLPTYSWSEFPWRELTYLWERFDGGVPGGFAIAFYVLALAAHGAVLLFARRRPLLQAVALAGLTNFSVFSFAVYELVDGGVRAMAPPTFRYFQLFYYTSFVCLAWLADRAVERARPGAPDGRWTRGRPFAVAAAALLLVGAVRICAHMSDRFVGDRLEEPCGDLATLLCAVDQLALEHDSEAPPEVLVDRYSVRVLPLFRDPSTRPAVAWTALAAPELVERAAELGARPVLVDHVRLAGMRRYLDDDTNRELDTFQEILHDDYRVWFENARFTFYRPDDEGREPLPLPNRQLEIRDLELPGWVVANPGDWDVSSTGELLLGGLPEDGSSLYLYSGDNTGFTRPPAPVESYRLEGSEKYELAVELGIPDGVAASIFFIQFDGDERIDQKTSHRLSDGLNRIDLQALPGATSYRLALRFARLDEAVPPTELPEVRSVLMSVTPPRSSCGCEG